MIRGAVVVARAYGSLPVAPVADEWLAGQPQTPSAPSASEWARHANDRSPRLARIPAGVLIFVLFLVLGGVTFYFGVQRSPTGEIVDDGRFTVNELLVGDCFDNGSGTAEEVEDVIARPCSDAHQFEVFWTGSMTDGAYPSKGDFEAFMDARCYAAFESYLDVGYSDTWLDIYWFHPTKDGWGLGDRSVQCAVFDPDNPRLTGSLKGFGPQKNRHLPL
jgi:hypothetical protein